MSTVQDIVVKDPAARAAQAPEDLQDIHGEKMILNMGPSHPATHGVLRIVLELDGEIITKATPDIGYLHRGDEKIAENMTYNQFVPYTDRLDYLAPLANNVAYAMAVEKLMGIDRALPPRCQYIRVMCCELARISAHLLGLGSMAMDVGALTVFLYTFTQRETIYNLIEALTGARFTTSYTRVGGVARDLPPGWVGQCRKFLEEVVANIDETEQLLSRNKIFVDRTRDIGHITRETAIDYAAALSSTCARRIRTWSMTSCNSRFQPVRSGIVMIVTWCGSKKCGRACSSCGNAWTKFPAGPTTLQRSRSISPTARFSCPRKGKC
jgi:NADH-quinone oxidoreductase subunit D